MPKIGPSNFIETLPFCVLSDDGHELTGPMTEKDARAFLGLLEAVKPLAHEACNYDDFYGVPDDPDDRKIDGIADITVGHCRAARTAYQAATGRTA